MKKQILLLIFILIQFLSPISLAAETHPSLLFSNVSSTPGYMHRTSEPWATWERDTGLDANSDNPDCAALHYLISGSSSSKAAAIVGLKTFYNVDIDYVSNCWSLKSAVFGYDFIQPYLNSSDDNAIRDRIATFADELYWNQQVHGIDSVDYSFRCYPLIAIAGMALADYNKSLPHGSNPAKWRNVTSDLLVQDTLQNDKAMVYWDLDYEGSSMLQCYEAYYLAEFALLAQTYSFYYNQSIFSDYPILKKNAMSRLWGSLPNRYGPNRATCGNVKFLNMGAYVNLLDPANKSFALKYSDYLENDRSLPYTRSFGVWNAWLNYLTYDNYSSIPRADPSWTTHLSNNSVFQTFRRDWADTSPWASLTIQNQVADSGRAMTPDQLNFDYYDKGNYLVADSGEVKYRYSGYGTANGKGHNTVMINGTGIQNPGAPLKGVAFSLITPAELGASLVSNVLDYAESEITWGKTEITDVFGEGIEGEGNINGSVIWKRAVLFPNKEYFILLDSINNSQQRKIYNLFHLTSFYSHSPTEFYSDTTQKIVTSGSYVTYTFSVANANTSSWDVKTKLSDTSGSGTFSVYINDNLIDSYTVSDAVYVSHTSITLNAGSNTIKYALTGGGSTRVTSAELVFVGIVDGNLAINGSKMDFRTQKFNDEINVSNSSLITWNTTNMHNQRLETNIYSIPASSVSVQKYWMRIGGYDEKSEVDHPLVRFKVTTDKPLYRITSFYTRYLNESVKNFSEVGVIGGNGSALRIRDGLIDDLVFLGDGNVPITAGSLGTDARIAFTRSNNSVFDMFFINDGSFLSFNGSVRFNSSRNILGLLKYSSSNVSGQLQGPAYYSVAIRTGFASNVSISSVVFNGVNVSYTYVSGILFASLSGSGDLVIAGEGSDVSVASSDTFFPSNVSIGSSANISARVRNTGSQDVGSFTVRFFDGGSVIGSAVVSSLSVGAYADKTVSWTPAEGGWHTVSVVADADSSIDESDESNNRASVDVFVSYPADLYVSSSRISFSDSQPAEYDVLSVYVNVSNNGGLDATVAVACFDGPAQGGVLIGSGNTLIPRNSSVRLTYSWTAAPAATHGIYVSVDPDNTVSESNEANNVAYRNIYVYTRPDLYIDPANISSIPSTIYSGSPVTLRARVYNLGESDSGVFSVRYSDGSTRIGETSSSVGGESSVDADITWTPAASGNRNISVVLDPYDSVSDGSEGNNAASKNFYVNQSASITTTSAASTTTEASTTTSTTAQTTTTIVGNSTTTTIVMSSTTTTSSAGGTTTSVSGTTSSPATTTTLPLVECNLKGDYSPCGVVSLQEVIDAINQWTQEEMALGEIVDLIAAWAAG